jgi:hypothetical protein
MTGAQQRPKIDIAKVISDFVPGATIVGPGSKPNTVKIKTGFAPPANTTAGQFDMGDEEEHEIDAMKLLGDIGKEQGFDPAGFDIQIGSKNAPAADNPMGLADRFKYEIAHTKKDKAEFLKNKFGAENMHYDAAMEQFRIKQDNTWYNAEKSGLAGFAGEKGDVTLGAVAGGVAGAKVGAGIGALTGPAAPLAIPAFGAIGGVVGAGLSAVVMRLGTMDTAKQVGLRTEQDAEEVKAELTDEFLEAATGEAIGLGIVKIPGASRAVKGFIGDKLGKLGRKITSNAGREEAAALMQQMTDVPKADNMTWMEPENYAGTKRFHDMAIKYEQTAPSQRGVHPVKKEIGDEIQNAVETVKKQMYEDFNTTMNPVRDITKNVEVDIAPVVDGMQSEFKAMGLIDDQGRWLKEGERTLSGVVTPSSINALKRTYGIVQRATAAAKIKGQRELAGRQIEGAQGDLLFNMLSGKADDQQAAFQALMPNQPDATRVAKKFVEGHSSAMKKWVAEHGNTNFPVVFTKNGGLKWVNRAERRAGQAASDPAAAAEAQLAFDPKTIGIKTELPATQARGRTTADDLPLFQNAAGSSPKSKAADKLQIKVKFDEVQTLVKNMDEMLEAAGQFNLGKQEITTPAKARIISRRKQLRDLSLQELGAVNPKAADMFVSANQKFSKRREWIDDIAGETSDMKIDKTMGKLFNENNDRQREVMAEIMKGANIDSQAFMNKLYQGRAAMSSVDRYKTKGWLATTGGAVGISSPRVMTPLASRTFNKIHKMAAATDFVRTLTPAAKKSFFTAPDAFKVFNQTLQQAYQSEDQVPDMLMNQAIQKTEPGR